MFYGGGLRDCCLLEGFVAFVCGLVALLVSLGLGCGYLVTVQICCLPAVIWWA